MGALDREFYRVEQRALPGRGGEQLQGVAGHRAIVSRALDRVFEGAVLFQHRERGLEVAVGDVALLQSSPPKVALGRRAASERQDDRQRDFALAEIVADIFAELGGGAAIIERVVDELEGEA